MYNAKIPKASSSMSLPALESLQDLKSIDVQESPCPEQVLLRWAQQARLGRMELSAAEQVLLASLDSPAQVRPVLLTLDPAAPSVRLPAGLQTYSDLLGERCCAVDREAIYNQVTPEHCSFVGYLGSGQLRLADGYPGITHVEVFEAEPIWRCLAWLDQAQSVAKTRLLRNLRGAGCPTVVPRFYWPGFLEVLAQLPQGDRPVEVLQMQRVGVPPRVLRALLKRWADTEGMSVRSLLTHTALRSNALQ